MLFKALSFTFVTFRAVGINQKKRMMYYIRNVRSLKMQRTTALELKAGPKKCIVIVHLHTCTMYHSKTSLDVDETLNYDYYSLGWT